MIKREYHSYSVVYDDNNRLYSEHDLKITIKSWFPKSIGEIAKDIEDYVRENSEFNGQLIIKSLTRVK